MDKPLPVLTAAPPHVCVQCGPPACWISPALRDPPLPSPSCPSQIIGTLEEIHMPQNGINHPGVTALAQAFAINPLLRVINLNDNTFTEKGAVAMAKVRRVWQAQVGPGRQGLAATFAGNPSAGSCSAPLPSHLVCTPWVQLCKHAQNGCVSQASTCPSWAGLTDCTAFFLSCLRVTSAVGAIFGLGRHLRPFQPHHFLHRLYSLSPSVVPSPVPITDHTELVKDSTFKMPLGQGGKGVANW